MVGRSAEGLEAAAAQWRDEGWVLLDGLVPLDMIEAARAEAAELSESDPEAVNPSRRLRTGDRAAGDRSDSGAAFRAAQFTGTTLFPFRRCPRLNELVIDHRVVDFARLAMQADDIRIYQARLWSKEQGRVNYEQPLHRDLNHSLVPTRSEPGWWHLETFLYLTDVEVDTGAPRLVPRSASGVEPDTYDAAPLDAGSALYRAEISAPGRAGSLLAYRSDVWHRGVDLTRPGSRRQVLVIAFKLPGLDWIGYDSHAPLSVDPAFADFVVGRSPDELALFNVPAPGHAYWTAEMVERFGQFYPGLDVEPWREAL